ncbi:AP-2 complex subunit mu, partial [Tanacetum coccineum]
IRKFPGQTEATLSAEVELISTIAEKKSWTRPPIQMEFQVPMFTASGLRVRFGRRVATIPLSGSGISPKQVHMRSDAEFKRIFTDICDDMVTRLELVIIKLSVHSVNLNGLNYEYL